MPKSPERKRNRVEVGNEVTISGGSITATSNTEYGEDASHSTGATGSFVLAVRNDAGTSLVDADGDYAPFQVDSAGALVVSAGASPVDVKLPELEISLGNVTGYSKINKFGEALDCDLGVDTDIWDGADGTTSTDVWVAPTTARTHDIASTDANDDGDPVGTGMRTVRVYGLTAWDSAETSEDITLNGTSNVATSNSYVIIHRMKGLTFGSGGTNAGIITATAQTDSTVTAAIQAGEGQTLMCIYGVPSTQTIHLFGMRADILRSVASAVADLTLLVKEDADQSDSAFITKEKFQFGSTSPLSRSYSPLKSFTGPCIIKVQVSAGSNNCQVTASFDAYLVNN